MGNIILIIAGIQSIIIILLIVKLIKSLKTIKRIKRLINVNLNVNSEEINNNLPDTKNMLILGNSISIHGICDYWWGEWGMASSTKEKDYVHLLAGKMAQHFNINFDTINFASWEYNSHDRTEVLLTINSVFNSKKYDYVIIQLGENVTNATTLEKDLNEMIKFIKSHNSSVKIAVVGNFWSKTQVDKAKIKACGKSMIPYIDLTLIQNEDYYAKIGTIVFGQDGKKHKIEHEGVARHPNDLAMEYIANNLFNTLDLHNS